MVNLAGVTDCDDTIRAELRAAGIDSFRWPFKKMGEVPTQLVGCLCGWMFERAWYYWVCSGPGLPIEVARRLYASNRHDVRVDGHCACPSPDAWRGGFAVGTYHVDSPEGLKALAEQLKLIRHGNVALLGDESPWMRTSDVDAAFMVDHNDA
jgi:hypothetical protein